MKQKQLNLLTLDNLSINHIPNKLPKPLIDYVQKLIDRIDIIKKNPLQEYKRVYERYKELGLACFSEEFVKNEYNEEIKELNRYNSRFILITEKEMIPIWNKFYKLNPKCLPALFSAIVNLSNKQCKKFIFDFNLDLKKEMADYSRLKEDPSELIEQADSLYYSLQRFPTIIAPDGSDCFEYLDVNDPEDKLFLDDNGDIPYHFNWDYYITDEEFEMFMNILEKIIDKLKNRKDANKTKKSQIIKKLQNPNSRKRKIPNATEIEFIKRLYVHFIETFNKPLYKEIVVIVNTIFGSEYIDNDVIKLTKDTRNNIKELKSIIRNDGFIKMNNTSYIENKIAEHIKSEDSKQKK